MPTRQYLYAETLMAIGGILAFLLTLYWVRKRDLREKYAVVWLFIGLLVLVLGVFPNIIMFIGEVAHLSYAVVVLFIFLSIIFPFAFSISISLSRQHKRNIRLTQEFAILEQRLRELENKENLK